MTEANVACELPPPPPDRTRGTRALSAVVALGGGAAAIALGEPFYGVVSVPFAGLLYLLHVARREEIGGALAMAALDRAARGRFDEARALLAAISKRTLSSYVGMMVDSQRAALALYEGDLEKAVTEATKAAREGKRLGIVSRIHQGSALSIRAVARAGLGRKEEALADVARVRTAQYRQGSFMARAALAEALVFAREKDLDSLAKLLREERALLFGATGPRERMVVRALSRMVAARKVSVYREPAKRDEQELDEQASWVARIAPEAASFAQAPKLGARLEAPEVLDAKALASAQKAAPKAKPNRARVAALWALLVVLFLAIWSLLPVSDVREATMTANEAAPELAATSPIPFALLLMGATIATLVGVIAFRVMRARKLTVELGQAMELRLRGRLEEARAANEKLRKCKTVLVAPQAERELAAIAASTGDFETARRHAEAGILATRVSAMSLGLCRPIVLPQLHGELAFALAAEGSIALAEKELETIRSLSPSYPYLAKDTFRVRLVGLAATGRLDEAAEMARQRPVDLPLSMHEEILCDALRVHAGDVLPEGERERIELDLREDAALGRFLDCAAKTLRSTLHTKGGPRIAPLEPHAAEEHESRDVREEHEEHEKKAARLPAP